MANYITRWQLPDSGDNDAVTIRRLLGHTAGLTDGLLGIIWNEPLPSLEQELSNLVHPQIEVKMAVGHEPGSEFLYSGGGYLLLQLLVEK